MKKTGLILLAGLTAVLLAGCKEEAKSEAWYQKHPDETYQVYKKCLEDGENSKNCDAAHNAALVFADINHPDTQQKFLDLLK